MKSSIVLVFCSSRDPVKRHRVTVLATNPVVVKCTCPAGRRGGKCKHIRLLSLLREHGTEEEIRSWYVNQPGW